MQSEIRSPRHIYTSCFTKYITFVMEVTDLFLNIPSYVSFTPCAVFKGICN